MTESSRMVDSELFLSTVFLKVQPRALEGRVGGGGWGVTLM